MWVPVCVKSIDAFGVPGEEKFYLSSVMILVHAILAIIDLLIVIVAGIQVGCWLKTGSLNLERESEKEFRGLFAACLRARI